MLTIAQDIELFQQFNGRYDYLAFGNTLNTAENTGQIPPSPCEILTESSADFNLQPGQTLVAAYLYWAGSSETGDLEVLLNGSPVVAARTFSLVLDPTHVYFAAFADVTSIVQANGNGTYTVSEFDITADIPNYCNNTTNFGGWAVTIIYEDPAVSLNQVNVFDGLESVSSTNTSLTIELDNLNVLDNTGAKIGFLAWEGDASLAVAETLQINGNIISNPPLNPADNQFNSTNSFTGSDVLFNMDIDFYNIENNIQPGDTTATIDLTSGQDFVMINNVITVLNTELPDATIEIDEVIGATECGDRDLEITYTVYNENSTDELPSNTPIAFYANTTLIGQSTTTTIIPIGGSESGIINVSIPTGIPADFDLKVFVDDDGSGNGTVNETNEQNNGFIVAVHLLVFPEIVGLHNLELCDVIGTELFDLTQATSQINPINAITFHVSEQDAIDDSNPIDTPETYENTSNPQTIWIRVSNPDCFLVDSFDIEVIECPLPDATITIDNDLNACRKRELHIDYTVYNIEATGPLPAATAIAFYANGQLVGQSQTQNVIPIGGSEPGSILVTLPETIPDTFDLLAVVDDDGTGTGSVQELNDFNNDFGITVTFGSIPPIGTLPPLLECDEGFDTAHFNLTEQNDNISTNPNDIITYYTSFEEAETQENPISDPGSYENLSDPQVIYVRLENDICFTVGEFLLTTENCPPFIPQGFSPNSDGINDVFEITGLLNVYENFELQIFSREGNRIYIGHNEDGFWDGIATEGLLFTGNLVPVGTYYYVLNLNDPEFTKPFLGFVYINY
ncbi:gliding motility-associated-like protein [Ulvibacter sp. MAR_2010_11]|uniref:T9SS type B sorting domain-containing protein n=1 Tax=Ulvibacter sp. MAR_2010_11 TaxID=1250229 RepID=UPI000CB65326|nr:gliding motility-associated C-terminal domain-containing protein [Ulvibacter sp. MAR_2010_11]PKA83749.1 gliding motility-associated-like protein [Ulvibacter sp. MAR_2010_11]